jgi:16S rRNA (guanine(966)-N(2))-methyltransferase RsmD
MYAGLPQAGRLDKGLCNKMRAQLRIVAGRLRGRKLTVDVGPHLRPAPQRLREALFSILGNAVPDRPFYDLFAGTGAVGVEALSRGASRAYLVERDFRTADAIERHLRAFQIADQAHVVRADVYRWVERWPGSKEPVNLFVGPPYPDFQRRLGDIARLIGELQARVAPGSVLTLQSEETFETDKLPHADWDIRRYGRNMLLIWVKEAEVAEEKKEVEDTGGEDE